MGFQKEIEQTETGLMTFSGVFCESGNMTFCFLSLACLMGELFSDVSAIKCFWEEGRRTLREFRSLISALEPPDRDPDPPLRRWSWRYSSTGSAGFRTDWCLLEFFECMKKASHNPTSFSRKSTKIRSVRYLCKYCHFYSRNTIIQQKLCDWKLLFGASSWWASGHHIVTSHLVWAGLTPGWPACWTGCSEHSASSTSSCGSCCRL